MACPTATRIDFNQTPLAEVYGDPKNYFAIIIDNAFTPAECDELIALAESSGPWIPAAKNVDIRDSLRIRRVDAENARMIFERVEPFLGEVRRPGKELEHMTGKNGGGSGEKGAWELAALNEILRFLKYEEKGHFHPHCDATYNGNGEEKRQKSFLTLHLYLTDDESLGLKGGATRFWDSDWNKFVDVEAKRGRVLIFQQRMLWHSGEPVTAGTKITMRSDVMYRWVPLKPTKPKGEKKEEGGGVDERAESAKENTV
ncbi:hypothetical protein L873DRAFT_1801964 [Choiromyces venosus 120613-1]|uniref:Fe2OG dioxygenase domain-containing protein n=1 Tax=Choiromyces venosus 120613-1 TaxID=1336337 RepID=A0A3N4JZP8_9PEZI|nr:hypothetical protein L873DRAFT_1801964 [Choiromyces venosus 120613-1]